MSEGKLIILGAVMKHDRPFRARHIYEATSCSRQLVDHHLKMLVRDGLLEKNGVFYAIYDKEELINEMIEAGTNKSPTSSLKATVLLNEDKIEAVNNTIKYYLALHALGLPHARMFKRKTVVLLEETIDALEKAKRWTNTGVMQPNAARKFMKKFDAEDWWKTLGKTLSEEMSKTEFYDWYYEVMKEEEE